MERQEYFFVAAHVHMLDSLDLFHRQAGFKVYCPFQWLVAVVLAFCGAVRLASEGFSQAPEWHCHDTIVCFDDHSRGRFQANSVVLALNTPDWFIETNTG